MINSISRQYDDELNRWNESIEFYIESLESLGDSLAEVISRNSIVDIAAKVEVYQVMLDKVIIKLKLIVKDVEGQEKALRKDDLLIDDGLVTVKIQKNQKSIRDRMLKIEKEYIEVKHDCNEFLSSTLKK